MTDTNLTPGPQAPDAPIPPTQPHGGLPLWAKIAIGVVGAIIAIGILGAIVGEDKDKKDSGTAATTEPTEPTTTTEPPRPENDGHITLVEFEQIQNGMTYEQVVAIVGGPGTLNYESDLAGIHSANYEYGGDAPGANAQLTFQNDVLTQKVQFGLE